MDIKGVTSPNVGAVTQADPKIRQKIEKSLSAGVTNKDVGEGKVVGEQQLREAIKNLEKAIEVAAPPEKSMQYRKEIDLLVGLIEKNGNVFSIPPEEVLELKEVLKKYSAYNSGILFEKNI